MSSAGSALEALSQVHHVFVKKPSQIIELSGYQHSHTLTCLESDWPPYQSLQRALQCQPLWSARAGSQHSQNGRSTKILDGASVRAEPSDWLQTQDRRRTDYGMGAYDSIFGLLTGINLGFISTPARIMCLDHRYTGSLLLVLNYGQKQDNFYNCECQK